MKANMGMLDRAIRVIIALTIAFLYFTGRIHGILAIVLGIFAVTFVLTSLVSFCPLYVPLGLSTRKKPEA